MLLAVLADFLRIPNCRVVTTWDARLGPFDVARLLLRGNRSAGHDLTARITVTIVHGPDEEAELFRKLAAECDAVFAIAPESDNLLADRRRMVDEAGGRFLGCSLEAIRLCTDKLQLADYLQKHDVPTISTAQWDGVFPDLDSRGPLVIKPRDGAGSQNTFLISQEDDLHAARTAFDDGEAIWQPYIQGLPVSVAALISSGGRQRELFPIAEQRLSDDGRFRYLGGRVPILLEDQLHRQIEATVRRAGSCVPGLKGYVGFDLIAPRPGRHGPALLTPLLVEINPRLTTSYLGYRDLTEINLAERMLFPEQDLPEIVWESQRIAYDPDGRLEVLAQ